LIQGAVEGLEISKMQEVVTMLANLWDAAHRLPEGTERQNALREIRGYQIRMANVFVEPRPKASRKELRSLITSSRTAQGQAGSLAEGIAADFTRRQRSTAVRELHIGAALVPPPTVTRPLHCGVCQSRGVNRSCRRSISTRSFSA
jgi:hypothetical protein